MVRVEIYLQHFRPAGTIRCTDSREIWYSRGHVGLLDRPKIHANRYPGWERGLLNFHRLAEGRSVVDTGWTQFSSVQFSYARINVVPSTCISGPRDSN